MTRFTIAEGLSFTERTVAAGVACAHGLQFPEYPVFAYVMAGGGAAGDFDRDGWQDLFVVTGGNVPDRLFINNRDGTFTDRAAEWGVGVRHVGVGAAVGDYDGDGWLDIYVTSYGPDGAHLAPGQHRLYRNGGDGSFANVAAAAGVHLTSPATNDGWSAAFGDYDNDGDLDLAVTGWLGSSAGNRLFRNDGDGTFTDVTLTALDYDLMPLRGLNVRFADMDGDRQPELLWVSDFGRSTYFINMGGGTFHEATAESGTGLDSNGMGTTTGDFDGDGLLDWYVTSIHGFEKQYTGNMLYMNLGEHQFNEVSETAGVNDGGWGWGAVAADFDHDGLEDIAETNGWYFAEWLDERCKLFRNLGDGTFEDVAGSAGLSHQDAGRGLVRFDYDNDGDQDVVVFTNRGPLQLFRNDLAGPATNWLRLMFDTRGHADLAPDGFGTRVLARTGATTRLRYFDGGSAYLSTSELALHFGLADAPVVDELRVEWANGTDLVLAQVPVNRTIEIIPGGRPGDVDADGLVGVSDLLAVLSGWGVCDDPSRCPADADHDGTVGVTDLLLVLSGWY